MRRTRKTGRPGDAAELRKRAEEIAQEKAAQSQNDIEILSPEKMRAMLHKLQVHQTELEMQNAELRMAKDDAVRKSEDRLRFALEACHMGAWDLDLVDHTVFRSIEHDRIFGYTELLPQWTFEVFLQHVQPEYRPELNAALHVVTTEHTGLTRECRIQRADGEIRWIWFSGRFIEGSPGHNRMAGIVQDITDRKLADAALQESELRFRTMANAIPQLAWIAEPDGCITWYNQRWYDYTGTTFEQMKGWGWQSIHDPGKLPNVLKLWKASLETHEPFEMTFPLRGADGIFRPFLTRIVPIKDADGRLLQWFGTNTDVSKLKRVEQSLRDSEAIYRSIGESIDYGVWICSADGMNTYASKNFLNLLGITQEQCSNFGWIDFLPPDDIERTVAEWKECVRTESKWDYELRFRGADGRWHDVLARWVPVRNRHGKIVSWSGINLDISRIKRAEEQIKASLVEKEVLLKEVHHRVKNNLQVISSLLSLQAGTLPDDQSQDVFDDVIDRVRTMALVHEKLYQTENLARLDFSDYASSLLAYLWNAHGAATGGRVRLKISVPPVLFPLETAMNCGLILNELASNAIRHAFPGGIGGEIAVTLEHDPVTGAACLRVRDNGVGLPADQDWRQSPSLGLRLLQILAGQMRATIQTGQGSGTEFQISFNIKGTTN